MKFGMMFNGFKEQKYYWWEAVMLYTKVLLVMVTVYLRVVSPETQVLVALMLLITCMMLHVRFNPFRQKQMNYTQLYSLQVTSLTIYSGMFYVTGTHYEYMNKDSIKWFFLFLILVPNIIFFIYWLKLMFIELLKLAH